MADTEVPQLHKRRRRCLVSQVCPFRRLSRKMRCGGNYDVGAVQAVSGGQGMWSPFEQADPDHHEPEALPALGVSVGALGGGGGGSGGGGSGSSIAVAQQEAPDSPAMPAAHDPYLEIVDPETGEVAQ